MPYWRHEYLIGAQHDIFQTSGRRHMGTKIDGMVKKYGQAPSAGLLIETENQSTNSAGHHFGRPPDHPNKG
jgi:hypothetical protein